MMYMVHQKKKEIILAASTATIYVIGALERAI